MREAPSYCENCKYETIGKYFDTYENKWLCRICAETYLSKTDNLNRDMVLLFKSIAYIGNMILDEIKRSK